MSAGIWNSHHEKIHQNNKTHLNENPQNCQSIRFVGSIFWGSVLNRWKRLNFEYLCKGEILKGYLGLLPVQQTLVLKWTMCSSASYCFPFTVCSLPWPAHEPQWACICHTCEMVFVAGNLEIDLPYLGFCCWLPALNGLIWQVLPWTGQEWLLQWDYCPQLEAWQAMMRPCWWRTTQNPDDDVIMIIILL